MNETREAEELVALWQELQVAQVAGDTRRLAELRRLAEARAGRAGASGEWRLLAREAGRHTERIAEQIEAQPVAGVGGDAAATYEVEQVAVPDAAREPAEEEAETGRGRRLGPLIWIVVVAVYVLLQIFGNVGEGSGP